MKKLTHLLCCALFTSALLLPTPSFSQGAQSVDGFINPTGRTTFTLANCFEKYARQYEGSELTDISGNYTVNTSSLFGTYSMTDDFEATVFIPFVATNGFGKAACGLQDLQFNLNCRMFDKSVEKVGRFSVLTSVGVTNPLSRYRYTDRVSIGQHSVNIDFIGALHYEREDGFFMTFSTGYTKRATPFPDFYSNVFKTGVRTDDIYVGAYLSQQKSFGGQNLNDENPEYFLIGQSFTKVGLEGYYAINQKWSFCLGAGYTLDGSNVGRALRLTGGLTYSFGGFTEMKRVTEPDTNTPPGTGVQ